MTTIQDDARHLAGILARHGNLTLKDLNQCTKVRSERRDLALTYLERMGIIRRSRPMEGLRGVSRTTLVRVDKVLAGRFAAGPVQGVA